MVTVPCCPSTNRQLLWWCYLTTWSTVKSQSQEFWQFLSCWSNVKRSSITMPKTFVCLYHTTTYHNFQKKKMKFSEPNNFKYPSHLFLKINSYYVFILKILHTSILWRAILNHSMCLLTGMSVCRQGRAVDPRTTEHSGVEVPTPELFWGWILFWDWELCSGVVSPYAMRGQLCTHTFVSYNYSANHMSFLFK